MTKVFDDQYAELQLSVADIDFIFFVDQGFVKQGNYCSERHCHEFYEMFYCFQGSIEIRHNGGTEALEAGNIGIIPPAVSHSLRTSPETYYMLLSFWNGEQLCPDNAIRILKNIPIDSAFHRMLQYYYSSYQYRSPLILACLHEIVAMILEFSNPPSPDKTVTLENNRYRRYIIEHFFGHFAENPKITELAEQLHLSVHQTQRIIFGLYHRSFRKQLTHLRVERAKELLRNSTMPVNEIAVAVGYKCSHSFYSVFKSVTGTTPLSYRRDPL